MKSIKQTFEVPFSFNIIFTENLFSADNQELKSFLENFGNSGFHKKILLVSFFFEEFSFFNSSFEKKSTTNV
jgi:hypothetical protein